MTTTRLATLAPSSKPAGGHVTTAREAWNTAREIRDWWRKRTSWTVSVSSDDQLYQAAHRWFLDNDAHLASPPRAVEARARRSYDDTSVLKVDSPARPGVDLYYDERGAKRVTISGHPITVILERGDAGLNLEERLTRPQPNRLQFVARTRDGMNATINLLERLAAAQDQAKPGLWMLNTWGSWQRRDDLPPRQLESVVLADGQAERLHDDLRRFLDSEPDYIRRGLPWHRGYLLHGPPGTGKTSIVRALAYTVGLDLWYAPLGDLRKDGSLLSMLAEVRPRSILLLEDVDIFHATRERDDTNDGVSMAGLLNALDGVATPHGLITFMTTNDPTVLDDALTRPGRIDLREEIGLPDAGQVVRLFTQFYGSPPPAPLRDWSGKASTAELMGVFRLHDDPAAAWAAITERERITP